MAHLTNSAVDGLLGLLTTAVKDEAKLLKGVEGDIQFIKDEMDSMNGFLMHLTKTTTTNHDDQVRAWMKQVRDIAYVADDNIKLYMRDLVPPEKGFLAWLRHKPKYILTMRTRRRVAKDIKERKERVREVGKRRLRYGVDLPKAGDAVPPPPSDQDDDDKMREDFRRALLDEPPEQPASFVIRWAPPFLKKKAAAAVAPLSPIENTINKINCSDAAIKEALKDYFLKKPVAADDDVATSAMKMLLCTLYAYPYRGNKKTVDDLLKKLEENKGRIATWDVMFFSYSMLSTPYKSCLQYLTTFNKEKSISRTCLVRRWVAEGLLDAAAPAAPTGLKLKSCVVPDGAKEFIYSMSKNENFVSNLPTHLQHQVEIRRTRSATNTTTTTAAETAMAAAAVDRLWPDGP
uniref:Disease resistance N-terminal domain-containing protein n=1 Tax=Oryza barthii TaxID=65489 RepID=A0A0D3HPI0_9ORYZ